MHTTSVPLFVTFLYTVALLQLLPSLGLRPRGDVMCVPAANNSEGGRGRIAEGQKE